MIWLKDYHGLKQFETQLDVPHNVLDCTDAYALLFVNGAGYLLSQETVWRLKDNHGM